MTAADTMRRQRELQVAQRERLDRRCSRGDCNKRLVPNSTGNLCARHWRIAAGFPESDMQAFKAAPTPPVGLSRVPQQSRATRRDELVVGFACVLCGTAELRRQDHRGRMRETRVTHLRQLIRLFGALGVPHVSGPRCQECEAGVRSHADKVAPVIAYVAAELGRFDLEPEDFFGVGVVLARLRGEPVPQPPARPFGHVLRPVPEPPPRPLTNEELTQELARVHLLLGAGE